jgi:ribosomal-protein-alanine N-acetyltransferase
MAAGTAYRLWRQPLVKPTIIIGKVSLTQVARGAFQNAMLGYAIDREYEGLGLMREALQAVVTHAFSAEFNLHRIQANIRPENLRSIGIIQRLGFEQEGLAREYLFIDGAWRDHLMFALRNPDYQKNAES